MNTRIKTFGEFISNYNSIKLSQEGENLTVKNTIVEKSGDTYSSGCVMLYFNFPEVYKIQDAIDPDDLYEEDGDRTYGFENEPHITLLYGLNNGVSLDEVTTVLNEIRFGECVLYNISLFENEYDVLKFDVRYPIKGNPFLYKANKELSKLPLETSYPDYHPHMTIAYIKKGKGQKYCDEFKDIEHTLKPSHAVFSQSNGTKSKIKINTD